MQRIHKISSISPTGILPSGKMQRTVHMQSTVHMQRTVYKQAAADRKRATPMQRSAGTWKSAGRQPPMGIAFVPVVCVWVAGLLLAGSDGPFMPWVNGLGALVFAGASLVLARLSARLDAADQTGCPSQYCRPKPMAERAVAQKKECPKIGRPYAVGF